MKVVMARKVPVEYSSLFRVAKEIRLIFSLNTEIIRVSNLK